MKKPKRYLEFFDPIQTQKAIFEIIDSIEDFLKQELNLIKLNLPLFYDEAFKDFFLGKSSNIRRITFSSVSDYNVYSIFDRYEKYLANVFLDSKIKHTYENNFNSLYFVYDVIERDKEVDEILEIQAKYLELIVSVNKEEKKPERFLIQLIYKVIYETYKKIKRVLNMQIILNGKINIYYEKQETSVLKLISSDNIKYDLASKEGTIIWVPQDQDVYKLLGLSTATNEILELFEIKNLKNLISYYQKDENFDKYETYFKNNHLLHARIDLNKIIIFLLEKYSEKELYW